MALHLFCNQVTAVRFCHGAPKIWAVIELGFLAVLQAVVGGFDSHTVHQNNSGFRRSDARLITCAGIGSVTLARFQFFKSSRGCYV